MNEAKGYYAKWNKSERERQMPHDYIYGMESKFHSKAKFVESKKQIITHNKMETDS